MTRQHCPPLLLGQTPAAAVPLPALGYAAGSESISEAYLQELIHAHPASLPIAEIDPMFAGPVAICRELDTSAGRIDNFLVTPSGLPIIVECKLWRNPEGRREVVGQILDYAKQLSRWSSSDLQREVRRCLGRAGDPVLELVREADRTVDEISFNDALTKNLRRGRFLLLIVGDGIREGVEAIAEYLQAHAGLHFSLGLVEMPIYSLPDGGRLVAPRVLARTMVITRHVVATPDGYVVEEPLSEEPIEAGSERKELQDAQQQFWTEFLDQLTLDDPEQPKPRPARLGYLRFMLPAPTGSSWLTVYRDFYRNKVGVFLSASRASAGEYAMEAIARDWDAIRPLLNGTVALEESEGRPLIIDSKVFGPLNDQNVRAEAFPWLRERTNTFINVLRPRVRSAVADYSAQSGIA